MSVRALTRLLRHPPPSSFAAFVFLMVPLGGLVFAFFQFGLHHEPLRALGFATACYMAFQVRV